MSLTSFQQSNCKETSHGLLQMPEDNTKLIIGSTCGAVLFIVLFITVFVLCLRRMEVNLSRKAVSQFVVPKSSLREDNIEGRGIFCNLPMKCILPGMISDFEEAVNLGKLFLFRTQFTIKQDLFFLSPYWLDSLDGKVQSFNWRLCSRFAVHHSGKPSWI